jgi:hypothetical protein
MLLSSATNLSRLPCRVAIATGSTSPLLPSNHALCAGASHRILVIFGMSSRGHSAASPARGPPCRGRARLLEGGEHRPAKDRTQTVEADKAKRGSDSFERRLTSWQQGWRLSLTFGGRSTCAAVWQNCNCRKIVPSCGIAHLRCSRYVHPPVGAGVILGRSPNRPPRLCGSSNYKVGLMTKKAPVAPLAGC